MTVTTAQLLFSIALAVISLIILWFAVYVLHTTMWGDRWVRKPAKVVSRGGDVGLSEDK